MNASTSSSNVVPERHTQIVPEERVEQPEGERAGDWAMHSKRIPDIVDNQVRSLRKRQLIDSCKSGARQGAYWGIRTDIRAYDLSDALPAPYGASLELANTPTRLKRLSDERQQQPMNRGDAVCDAALRRHANFLVADGSSPPSFPFDSPIA